MWQITDRLWLGNSEAGRDQQLFVGEPRQPNPMKTHLTLNVANDLQVYADVTVGLMDGPGNEEWALWAAEKALGELQVSGKPILVHCHEGRSRSVCVIAANLSCGNPEMSFDEALDFIRTKREDINPHPSLVADFKRVFGE